MGKLLKFAEVTALTGIGRSQLYRRISEGDFPQPVRVGPKSIRFREDDVQEWVNSRPRRNA